MNYTSKRKLHSYPVIACFMLFIFTVLAFSLNTVPDEYNKKEEKELAQAPKIYSSKSFNDFTYAWDSFVSDQFPVRDAIVSGRQNAELASGDQVVIGDLFLLDDDYIFTNTPVFTEELADALAALIADTSERSGIPFIYTIVPQKNYALAGSGSNFAFEIDKSNHENYIAAMQSCGISCIDCCKYFDSFSAEEKSEMYFKTDYHWNELGAYKAAEYLVKSLAKERLIKRSSAPLAEDFVWSDLTGTPYMGDLWKRISEEVKVEEYIPIYTPVYSDDLRYYLDYSRNEVPREKIVASGLNEDPLSYNGISTFNNPYLRIENPFAPEDLHVLLLRDSYQCSMTDYLSEVFTELDIIEPRAVKCPPLKELLNNRDIDLVICIYHNSNLNEDLTKYLSKYLSAY